MFRVLQGHVHPSSAVKYYCFHLTMLTVEDSGILPVDEAELTTVDDPDSGRLPDVVAETRILAAVDHPDNETYFSIAIQVFIPFLIAGFGMVGAGLVLDNVQVCYNSLDVMLLMKVHMNKV